MAVILLSIHLVRHASGSALHTLGASCQWFCSPYTRYVMPKTLHVSIASNRKHGTLKLCMHTGTYLEAFPSCCIFLCVLSIRFYE